MHNVTVDWRERRVAGYARAAEEAGKPSYFDAPLISQVTEYLWQGGCMGGCKLDDDFDLVVSLYPWEQYVLGPNTERIEITAYDSPAGMNADDLDRASDVVVDAMSSGRKVLVHCQAGLNRSALVAGRALMKAGYSSDEAINLLRKSRSPLVLCNETFERQLRSFDA